MVVRERGDVQRERERGDCKDDLEEEMRCGPPQAGPLLPPPLAAASAARCRRRRRAAAVALPPPPSPLLCAANYHEEPCTDGWAGEREGELRAGARVAAGVEEKSKGIGGGEREHDWLGFHCVGFVPCTERVKLSDADELVRTLICGSCAERAPQCHAHINQPEVKENQPHPTAVVKSGMKKLLFTVHPMVKIHQEGQTTSGGG